MRKMARKLSVRDVLQQVLVNDEEYDSSDSER